MQQGPTGSRTAVMGPVSLYQHAVRRLLGARNRVQEMVSLITRAAAVLDADRWKGAAGA